MCLLFRFPLGNSRLFRAAFAQGSSAVACNSAGTPFASRAVVAANAIVHLLADIGGPICEPARWQIVDVCCVEKLLPAVGSEAMLKQATGAD